MGRPIANESFLKALLTYGTFDAYHFFCPDTYHLQKFRKRLRELMPDPASLGRVRTSLQIALTDTLREQEFQVFHLGDFTYSLPFLAGIRNRIGGKTFPITGVTHSIDGVFMNSRYLELILSGLAPFDGIICSSQSALQAVEKSFCRVGKELYDLTGKKFENRAHLMTIPLGLEDSFGAAEGKEAARAFFQIPSHSVVALSVGRFSLRQKADWSPVLEMLARMNGQGELSNGVFILAGGGQESDVSLMKAMVGRLGLENRVLLFPNFQPELKARLYHAADFFVSPVDNFQETFGLTVVEAMICGLPVILSDFSGYREFLTHGREGYLIPTTWSEHLPDFIGENLGILDPSVARLYLSQTVALDLEKLRTALLQMVNDGPARAEMGRQASARALVYRWSGIIPQYEAFWAALKEESRVRPCASAGMDLLVGNPGETFSHFPSRRLSGSHMLSITGTGRQVLSSPDIFTRYEDVQVCLFRDLENCLLTQLLSGPLSVEKLRNLAAKALQAGRGQVDFHLLWLLKHGAVKLEP